MNLLLKLLSLKISSKIEKLRENTKILATNRGNQNLSS